MAAQKSVFEISRQRRLQLRWRAAGRCVNCGKPGAPSKRKGAGGVSRFCSKHLIAAREAQRLRAASMKQ
jgi:hypothetical protein